VWAVAAFELLLPMLPPPAEKGNKFSTQLTILAVPDRAANTLANRLAHPGAYESKKKSNA